MTTHPQTQPARTTNGRTHRAWNVSYAAVVAVAVLAVACSSSSGSKSAPATSTSSKVTTTTSAPGPTSAQAAMVAARPVEVHTPPGLSATKPAPLLILLHGYGATGAVQDAYLKLTPVADEHGMLYVHPDGTLNPLDKRYWNATDACCGPQSTVDDSAYITAIIADVKSRYTVDPKRVFIIGHSNGGFMAFRMACDHADEIAAIVSFEAATWADPSKCTPSEAVSVLAIHGTGDQTIKYDGDSIGGAAYPSATTTVQTWARYDGCKPTPDPNVTTTHMIEDQRPPATVTSYSSGCKPNGHVELWTQPDGPHIPVLSPTFSEQLVTFLLAHPKR